MKCIECSAPATFVRHTQFAGNHEYCSNCVLKEKDFPIDDNDTYWECLIGKLENCWCDRPRWDKTINSTKESCLRFRMTRLENK